MSHVILFVQSGAHPNTRTFCDYETIHDFLDHVCTVYENVLRQGNPHKDTITYNMEQLFGFIDEITNGGRRRSDVVPHRHKGQFFGLFIFYFPVRFTVTARGIGSARDGVVKERRVIAVDDHDLASRGER
uniref:Enhancer of rudimentary homolog n=1 Tax=Anopheles farauti TaxID=69004 RepID=A0A182QJV6_9DIPT